MKKIGFLIVMLFSAVSYHSYAQHSVPKFEGSKEEAIAILRNSEFINILRHVEDQDSSDNIDRFLVEVDRIVPMDRQKREALKAKLLDVPPKDIRAQSWLMHTAINVPSIAPSILKILEETFSASDYEKLEEQLTANQITAISAYEYLTEQHMVMEEWVIRGFISLPEYIEMIYDYFDI